MRYSIAVGGEDAWLDGQCDFCRQHRDDRPFASGKERLKAPRHPAPKTVIRSLQAAREYSLMRP
jgi:hypothetical protein